MKNFLYTVIAVAALIACRQPQPAGGPCSYEEFNTLGRVQSVEQRDDGYSVIVELKGRPIEGRAQVDLDEVIRGGVHGELIEAYDIEAGRTLFFYVKQIVKGTCVPLYVILLEEDYRDAD